MGSQAINETGWQWAALEDYNEYVKKIRINVKYTWTYGETEFGFIAFYKKDDKYLIYTWGTNMYEDMIDEGNDLDWEFNESA